MKKIRFLLMTLLLVTTVNGLAGESKKDRANNQADLDARCEVVRQENLVLARAEYVDECIEKKQRPDRKSCERFYADYGSASTNRAPLFYDLPECVKAHDYKKSYRSSGR